MRVLVAMWLAMVLAGGVLADSQVFSFVEDAEITGAIERARERYLETAPHARLDVCVLLPTEEESIWRRGMVNGDALAYPASCVKLAYLAAMMVHLGEQDLPYDTYDEFVRPMIVESSNPATGHVVDILSGAPNIPDLTEPGLEFNRWLRKRQGVERWLDSRGLLERQWIFDKTFPSNTSRSPEGAEALARDVRGLNRMSPRLSASLMLEITHAAIENEANSYMLELLGHDLRGNNAVLGHGLPVGTIYENKPGVAYDTVEDIMRAILPNGQEIIVAAFSNARERRMPAPAQWSRLGTFMDLLIDELDIREGCPPRVQVMSDDPEHFALTGNWSEGTHHREGLGSAYYYHIGGSPGVTATWNLNVAEEGFHEVSVWWPMSEGLSTTTAFSVVHAGGVSVVEVDQTINGGRWVPLGEFYFRAGEGSVVLDAAQGSRSDVLVANAIQATKVPPQTPDTGTDVIVDNDHIAPAFEYVGDDWGVSPWRGHNNLTYAYAHIGTPSRAVYRAPLTEPGLYEVSTHYTAGPNRATQAVWEIEAADGAQTATIDQTGTGLVWSLVGTFRFEAGEAVATLNAERSAGGPVVIADAVRFVKVGE